jgi:hypothetical protein
MQIFFWIMYSYLGIGVPLCLPRLSPGFRTEVYCEGDSSAPGLGSGILGTGSGRRFRSVGDEARTRPRRGEEIAHPFGPGPPKAGVHAGITGFIGLAQNSDDQPEPLGDTGTVNRADLTRQGRNRRKSTGRRMVVSHRIIEFLPFNRGDF